MNSRHWLWKTASTIGLILTLGIGMNAEAGLFGFGGTNWKEEALLHDGSKLVVERTITRGGRHEIGQRPAYTEQSLNFTMPTTGEHVVWVDHFSEDLGNSSFLPMLIDVHQGIGYLVARPMGCLSYNKWGRPNPPYVVFKYQDKVWTRIPVSDLPAEISKPNIISSQPDTEVERIGKRLVPAETIQKIISSYRQPEFRSILREAFATAAGGCTEMIQTNDGWEGLGFFRLKANYEACSKYCVQKDVDQQACPCKKLFEGKK